jgi:hypothetical protein
MAFLVTDKAHTEHIRHKNATKRTPHEESKVLGHATRRSGGRNITMAQRDDTAYVFKCYKMSRNYKKLFIPWANPDEPSCYRLPNH